MLGIADDDGDNRNAGGKRKKRSITFNDEEEVINPEDIDPSVGRFRNLVHTSLVIPTKVNSIYHMHFKMTVLLRFLSIGTF